MEEGAIEGQGGKRRKERGCCIYLHLEEEEMDNTYIYTTYLSLLSFVRNKSPGVWYQLVIFT